jgi:hypothetical protein
LQNSLNYAIFAHIKVDRRNALMKSYADYLEEAENIDFEALSKSWANKTLPNTDEELDYEELTKTYADNLGAFMTLISDEQDEQ